jgi:pimeloyl-ACP methyl ester carboxylesterase
MIKKTNSKKSRLVILSDLNGKNGADWLGKYVETLSPFFDVKWYDCQELGAIDKTIESQIHTQFIEKGIDIAVDKLGVLESNLTTILAFSIGGTIAWKAILKGLKVERLIAVSATRLRYETQVPACEMKLYFGEEDDFKPNLDWFEQMNLDYNCIKKGKHECYKSEETAQLLAKFIVGKI